MKKLIIIIFTVTSTLSYAQNEGVIEYYNKIISLSNHYNYDLETSGKHYESSEESLISYKRSDRAVVSYLTHPYSYSTHESILKELEAEVLSAPSGLKNKETIVAHLKVAIASMNKNRDLCDLVSKYLDDKSYIKDTDLKQFYAHMDTFQINANIIYENCSAAQSLASEQTFKIELEFLKDAPFCVWIVPMKKDLRDVDLILEYLETNDSKLLKLAVEKIKLTFDAHKSTEGKSTDVLTDYYYKSVYEDFYFKLDEFLGRVIRENPNMSYISNTFGEIVEKYNLFISQYN
tara:strand:- start:34733 stop:35602 length:870 start_codon:yes stop_codon:yes gene_type:complete